jgi:hypothetical protein
VDLVKSMAAVVLVKKECDFGRECVWFGWVEIDWKNQLIGVDVES